MDAMGPITKKNMIISLRIMVGLFIITVTLPSSHEYPMDKSLKRLLRKCCSFDSTSSSSFNNSNCFKLIESKLKQEEITHTRAFKYIRKLWHFVSMVTKTHEKMYDTSVNNWTVNATRPELATRKVLVFNRKLPLTNVTWSNLTRLELLIPFYYVRPTYFCPRENGDIRNITVSYRGKRISNQDGTVPYRNMLVFRLPTSHTEDINGRNATIQLHLPRNLVFVHPKGSMLLEYYNMNEDITDEIQSLATAKAKKKSNSRKTRNVSEKNRGRPRATKTRKSRIQRSKKGKASSSPTARKRSINPLSVPSTNQRFCQLRKYVVKTREHLDLREIMDPKYINIGMCSGACNTIDLERTNRQHTARSVLLNLITKPFGGHDAILRPTCVPDVMLSTTLLVGGSGKNRLIIYNLHSAIIDSCRCV